MAPTATPEAGEAAGAEAPAEGASLWEPEVPRLQNKIQVSRKAEAYSIDVPISDGRNFSFRLRRATLITIAALISHVCSPNLASAQVDDVQTRIQKALQQTDQSIRSGGKLPAPIDGTSSPSAEQANQTPEPKTEPSPSSSPASLVLDRREAQEFYFSQFPKNAQFKAYQDWHRNHSVLSLLVNGADTNHLTRILSEFTDLHRRKFLILKEITILNPSAALSRAIEGNLGDSEGDASTPLELLRVLRQILKSTRQGGLGFQVTTSSADTFIPSEDSVRFSPVWQVRGSNGRYLYEGRDRLSDLFDEEGKFRGERGTLGSLTNSPHEVTESRYLLKSLPRWKTTMDRKTFSITKEKLKSMGINLPDDAYPEEEDEIAGGSGTIVLRANTDLLPQGFNTFDYLPRCKESQVKTEVLSSSLGFEVDMTLLDPDMKSDVERSFSTGSLPVPYVSTALFNPYAIRGPVFQELGRMWNVACLPSRLRIKDGARGSIVELREGGKAFDELSK